MPAALGAHASTIPAPVVEREELVDQVQAQHG